MFNTFRQLDKPGRSIRDPDILSLKIYDLGISAFVRAGSV